MTRGELDRAAKVRFAREAVVAQVRGLPNQLRARVTDGPRTPFQLPDPPDTALTRDVLALARSSYQDPLLGHCIRTWFWANLLGARDGIKPDAELLYLACLLHDIALTDDYRPPESAACFAVHGAEVARTTLADLGSPYADEVAEAIALHMNITVRQGPEAHLLHAGAHLDVAGTLPREAIRQVTTKHPRTGFPTCFATLMRREATERPNSRATLLWHLGMRLPLNHNPLD